MPQFRVTKTITLTFVASILVEADTEDAAIDAAGENEALLNEPSYTLPADDSGLEEQWQDDLDEDFEASEVESNNIIPFSDGWKVVQSGGRVMHQMTDAQGYQHTIISIPGGWQVFRGRENPPQVSALRAVAPTLDEAKRFARTAPID